MKNNDEFYDALDKIFVNRQCPTCGGLGESIGGLGKKKYKKCRDCGMVFSK